MKRMIMYIIIVFMGTTGLGILATKAIYLNYTDTIQSNKKWIDYKLSIFKWYKPNMVDDSNGSKIAVNNRIPIINHMKANMDKVDMN